MDGCSLTDAFPEGLTAPVNGKDTKSTDLQRKHERKKAKKCRGPQQTYIESEFNSKPDPDRPAVRRMDNVPALNPEDIGNTFNSETGLEEQGAFNVQKEYIIGTNSAGNAIGNKVPAFFGANPSDDTTVRRGLAEGFTGSGTSGLNPAANIDIPGEDKSYRMESDFAVLGQKLKGYAAAAGTRTFTGHAGVPSDSESGYLLTGGSKSVLEAPNLDMFWKTNGIAGGQSSYTSKLKTQPYSYEGNNESEMISPSSNDKNSISQKLDRIFARLDDMETTSGENAQTEVLLFIMTGLGVIFLMDLACRTACR